MNTHDILLDAMTKLGYPSLKGICFSISIRLLEACFIYQGVEFLQLIDRVVAFGANLAAYVEEAKVKKGRGLTERDKEVFDILAFFDSILPIQCPLIHYRLFNIHGYYYTALKAFSSLVEREQAAEQGGMVGIHSIPVIFTEQELTDYITKLTKAIEAGEIPADCPLGIIITGHQHSIALTCFPQAWMIMNINTYPPTFIEKCKPKELASEIKAAFTPFITDKTKGFLDLNISLHTLGKRAPFFTKTLKKLKWLKKEILLKQKSANRDIDGINLSYLAALFGHEHIVTRSSVKNFINTKLLLTATVNNNGKIVKELLKKGELVDQENDGITAAHIASANGHSDIINILIEYRANFNKQALYGITPAYFAAAAGHDEIIEQLIKLGVNFNLACVLTPQELISYAKEPGVVMYRIAKFIALKNTLRMSITPREIAALMGHDKIVQKIDKHLELNRIAEMAISAISHYKAPEKACSKAPVTFFTSCHAATKRALGVTSAEATSFTLT